MTTLTPTGADGATLLSHWGLIRARGADAASFLHGQLTNDMLNLPLGQARLAGYCSPKGRLLASFICWKEAVDGGEDLLLACHRSVLPATLKRLSMFVLRAKCVLSEVTADRPLWGCCGAAALPLVTESATWTSQSVPGARVLRLPDTDGLPRALWVGNDAQSAPPAGAAALPLDAWRNLDLASGIPVIEAGTADQFVPQMLNLELIGGVNFQKGCYPGQEVVARSQYRGTAKRRMFLFEAEGAAGDAAAAGTEVFHSLDPAQPAGMVVNSAPRDGGAGGTGLRMLVEVKLAALKDGSLHLGSADGAPLVRKDLPYEVPTEPGAPA